MVALRRIALAFLFLCTVLPAYTEARAAPEETQEPGPADAVTLPPLVPAEPAPESDPVQAHVPMYAHEPEARTGPSVPQPFRGLLESLGAGATGAVGGLLGMLLLSQFGDCDGDGCLGLVLLGGMGGAAVGVPIGVFGAGRLMGVRGGLGSSYLGMLIGGGSSVLLALAINDDEGLAFIGIPAASLLGAIIGFELSDDTSTRSELRHSSPTLSLTPTVGTTPRGGFVGGFSGRF
jgi:hypothetical protein